MKVKVLSDYSVGDMLARYIIDDNNSIGLILIPAKKKANCIQKVYKIDSLVQFKLLGDYYPSGFTHGHSMRNSESVDKLIYVEQQYINKKDSIAIITLFQTSSFCRVEHHLIYHLSYSSVESFVTFKNEGNSEVTLEMLASFSLTGITPFCEGDASETLILHRILSAWSAEGRLLSDSMTRLNFEPAWAPYGTRSLRFGQIGSMPTRAYFPTAFIEDTEAGVTWGVQIAHPASWQIEISRHDQALNLSGGLADREFGHWMKTIRPEHSFQTPSAYLTAVIGNVDAAAQRLTSMQLKAIDTLPKIEDDLPIIFNEYCTTWGNPTDHNIMNITNSIKDKGITYLVIDSGWYKNDRTNWYNSMGDWQLNYAAFPDGLEATTAYIRQAGMIPGIWFELEVCGVESVSFHLVDHLLKRDGVPITVGVRRFWDFRDPYVIAYLQDKVINFIKHYDFGYLKIDYNESLGIGCDGAESLGEGLRLQLAAVQSFFTLIKQEIPHLVIENCASGGHRLEPSMLAISSMSSFSDAHEATEIPIIAANLHRVMLPRQCQIWAVLRKDDSIQAIVYSISSTLLGRMCLSGDINDLTEIQWDVVNKGIAFYKQASSIIKNGQTVRLGTVNTLYRKPVGWQAIVRSTADEEKILVVIHIFSMLEEEVIINLPYDKSYTIEQSFFENSIAIHVLNNTITVKFTKAYCAACLLLSSE